MVQNYTNLVFQVKGAEGSPLVKIAEHASSFCDKYGVCMDLELDRGTIRVTPGESIREIMNDIKENSLLDPLMQGTLSANHKEGCRCVCRNELEFFNQFFGPERSNEILSMNTRDIESLIQVEYGAFGFVHCFNVREANNYKLDQPDQLRELVNRAKRLKETVDGN